MIQVHRREYRSFAVGVAIASALVCTFAGLWPYIQGAILGAMLGLLAGLVWMWLMLRRLNPLHKVIRRGALYGMALGVIVTLALHTTLLVLENMRAENLFDAGRSPGWYYAETITIISLKVGLPFGLFAGIVLGAACGGILRDRVLQDLGRVRTPAEQSPRPNRYQIPTPQPQR